MRQQDRDAFAWEVAQESARVIVPLVMEYVHPRSVVDVGCGVGAWLSVFADQGVKDVYGIDNDWVDRSRLMIPHERFFAKDLEQSVTLDKLCDLAVSLETAEHLDATIADTFIKNLTALAPVILFSAAIPYQGGVHHVNEQWPEYWEKKFRDRGFIPVDCIRLQVLSNPSVAFWYGQNTFLYVKETAIEKYPRLVQFRAMGLNRAPSLAHPYKYLYFAQRWESIVPFLGRLPVSWLHFGKKVMSRFFGR
jgi:SAM-dependent methyltransferase